MSFLKPFAFNSETYLNNKVLENKLYKHFMLNVFKGPVYRYMTENKYINKRLKLLIDEYIYENKIYREKEIIKQLKNYRVIRAYLVGVVNYNKKMSNKIEVGSLNYSMPKKEVKPVQLKLNTEDLFLNELKTLDEVFTYYDLDDLYNLNIEIADGLKPNVKKLKREY